jgi:hypothetical protein
MINDKDQLILLNDYRNGDYKKSKLKSKISDLSYEERRLNQINIEKDPPKEEGDQDTYYSFRMDRVGGVTNDYTDYTIISDSASNIYLTSSESNEWGRSGTRSSYEVRVPVKAIKKAGEGADKKEMTQEEIMKKLAKVEKEKIEEQKKRNEFKKFQVELFIEKLIKHTELIGPSRFDALRFIWNGNQELFWTGNNTVMEELEATSGSKEDTNFQVADYRTYWDEIIYEFDGIKKEAKGFKKLFKMLDTKFKKLTKQADDTFASEDPIKIMTLFKDALENLDTDEDQIKKMENFIVQLAKGKSAPMVARACQKLMVSGCELRLLEDGRFTKYVSEKQAVEFIKKSKRGLALDLMIDFPRAIPSDVIAKFEAAEELQVFDQYVILHYKPEEERPKVTHTKESAKKARKVEKAKEIARKKDPILFGLIRGSRNLYYIADWIDEKCDLTLEKMMAELGQEAYEL